MLMPSIWVELLGIVLTAGLLAADWYIWESRHRPVRQPEQEIVHHPVAEGKEIFQVHSASGRELVATLAAQSPDRNVLPFEQAQGR